MNNVIAVVGPTAVGKTSLSFSLAAYFKTELISCDAYQIYKGMNIGTAKPTARQLATYTHHLIDIAEPGEAYSAAAFQAMAAEKIEQLQERHKLPILVGGTGLYIQSLLEGYAFAAKRVSQTERAHAETLVKTLSAAELQAYIVRNTEWEPPDWHEFLANTHRLIRLVAAIEAGEGRTAAVPVKKRSSVYDAYVIGLTLPRHVMYERIERRIDSMLEQGWVDEVRRLLRQGVRRDCQAMKAIGYEELAAYLSGETALAAAVDTIKTRTRRFAKRQLTWYRRMPYIHWYEKNTFSTEAALASRVISDIESYYKSPATERCACSVN